MNDKSAKTLAHFAIPKGAIAPILNCFSAKKIGLRVT